MREYKFRGKRIRDGRWIYGSLVIRGKNCVEIWQYEGDNRVGSNQLTADKVIPETVGQWTGQKDADKKEIYENDFVLMDGRLYQVLFGGYYEYAAFGLQSKRNKGMAGTPITWDCLNPLYAKECKIVGKLHDNPELMEESKK